jgi:hypothetical protein
VPVPRASLPRRIWRKTWRIVLFVDALVFVVLVVWLVSLGRPRHEYFTRPRATNSAAVLERDTAAGSDAVQLTATDGFAGRLRVVRDFSGEMPRPVVLMLGGHRTGRAAASLVGDPGGIAVVAVDYPYDGPDKIRGVGQAMKHAPGMQRALLDTPRALSQAMDWVLTQPWADPARIELVGVSLGVPFAAVTGALDTRFSRVWIIQGGADNEEWLNRSLERRISHAWVRRPTAMLVHRLAHGASFDTEAWVAQIAPRPVIVIGALQDQRLPLEQVEQVYAAAGEPRELIWVDGGHVSPRRPETVRRLLEVVRARLTPG